MQVVCLFASNHNKFSFVLLLSVWIKSGAHAPDITPMLQSCLVQWVRMLLCHQVEPSAVVWQGKIDPIPWFCGSEDREGHCQWSLVAVSPSVWRRKDEGGNLAVALVGRELLSLLSSSLASP